MRGFTYNLLENEYSIGGHDEWDQTLSAYIIVTFKAKIFKAYAEFGFNDNRMYFADFLSQPDHSMSTIIGLRHYLFGDSKNWLWGFEWTNLMITYTSRLGLVERAHGIQKITMIIAHLMVVDGEHILEIFR